MPSWSKLLIPLAFGAAAGFVNWLAVRDKDQKFDYLVAKAQIEPGAVFADGKNLGSGTFPVPISVGISASDKFVVEGRTAGRHYDPGDLLLRQDLASGRSLDLKQGEIAVNVSLDGVTYEPSLLKVGSQIGFIIPSKSTGPTGPNSGTEVLGPYRLVAIGSSIIPAQSIGTSRGGTISVAVDFDEGSKTLKELGHRLVQSKVNREIVAVALYSEKVPSASTRNASLP